MSGDAGDLSDNIAGGDGAGNEPDLDGEPDDASIDPLAGDADGNESDLDGEPDDASIDPLAGGRLLDTAGCPNGTPVDLFEPPSFGPVFHWPGEWDPYRPLFWVLSSQELVIQVLESHPAALVEPFRGLDMSAVDVWVLVVPEPCGGGETELRSFVRRESRPDGSQFTHGSFYLPSLTHDEDASTCGDLSLFTAALVVPAGTAPNLCVDAHGAEGHPSGRLAVYDGVSRQLLE